MLLFFSVARSAQAGQAERAKQALVVQAQEAEEAQEPEEKMPTDKLVDISPLALRMSSPFNAQYWLNVSTTVTIWQLLDVQERTCFFKKAAQAAFLLPIMIRSMMNPDSFACLNEYFRISHAPFDFLHTPR